QSEFTTIMTKKSMYSNKIKKVIQKINTLWNKLVHNTIYCVKVRKEFVDIKNKKKYLSTREYRICEKVCE
ncbi:hypothetical protein P7M24_24500, partial [Vibrio parahaemolyticus]|nr:hypothetical protein [Vibrio parahaemolyticus]